MCLSLLNSLHCTKYTEINVNDGGTCMMNCGANINYFVHIEFYKKILDSLILADSKDNIYSIRQ